MTLSEQEAWRVAGLYYKDAIALYPTASRNAGLDVPDPDWITEAKAVTAFFIARMNAVKGLADAAIIPTQRFLEQAINLAAPNAIPGVSDLVRMELREVFRPEFRPTLLQEPPSENFETWMRRHGFDKYWSDSVWAAHWELPSLSQGFEMLHRLSRLPRDDPRYFGAEELDALLKQQDVLSYYRPRLKAIAYNPLTRVDVRRMYQLGVMGRDEVLEAYRQIGYDEANAERLTDFTVKDVEPEERTLGVSIYQEAFREGLILREEFGKALKDLGFSETSLQLILQLEDKRARRAEELAQERFTAKLAGYARRIRRASRSGKLDVEAWVFELEEDLGLTENDAVEFVVRNALPAKPREKDLTQAQVLAAAKKGVLTRLDALAELRRQGLDEQEALILLETHLKSK